MTGGTPEPHGTERVVVGRIGRAHGIRGEVSVEPRTDEPERRFTIGALLVTRATGPTHPGPPLPARLSIDAVRWHQGRLLVRFAELADRTAAEAVRGTELLVEVDAEESPEDPEEFYDHQLVGLAARTVEGRVIGTVREVLHSGAQDLLVIEAGTEGREVLVPFVTALVPVVDLAGGRLLVEDLPGLLDGA